MASTKKYIDREKIIFLLKAAVIGLLAGILVSIFRLLIETSLEKMRELFQLTHLHPEYFFILIGILLAVLFLNSKLIAKEPMIKGSGIPQIEAELNGEISMNVHRTLFAKIIGGVLAIGSGLFLGREGPSIQIGALVGLSVAKHTDATQNEKKIFLSSGAAAGLSAAFNAPIAGLLFILEEIHHTFTPLVWITSFISALVANFVSLNIFGLTPILAMDAPTIPLLQYFHLIIFGVLIGICARVYQQNLLALSGIRARFSKLPPLFWGGLAIALLIPIGYFYPQLLGGGNHLILELSRLSFGLKTIFIFLAIRYIFSMISYNTNFPGGIFLPILTIGALAGLLYGKMMSELGLLPVQFVPIFIILGMSAYFGGISKAPLTAMILVCEMVGDLHQLMPLGVATFVAYITVDFLGGAPIYEALLENILKHRIPDNLLTGQKILLDFMVETGSQLDGKMIREIPFPSNTIVTTLQRGEKEIFVHGDTLLHTNDRLYILSDSGHEKAVREVLEMLAKI